ncbi:NAD(P)H-dependent oxidoreductase [Leifsonia sp. F6_8S_P_1B]|uniref:NAD(P)H-dependent oxidoreductase n=1 Tax=Leifsonia williamsii TaxID=3035919 RepID=A0ABT8K9D9_9MICO|nr:NAD(P)H-dependent oxidoreductase [Leifsonia williamsii]MDN4614078.1 NAD(P)H-dependent oxidoreductase [Leifsonia williamsii]
MTTLIVTAHPHAPSLTSSIAAELAEALGPEVELADLAAEGFDPRFTLADRRTYLSGTDAPADVVAEQRRVDRATDLVLVFPVFWWSMPALLKGWIDRVFVNGWAFSAGEEGGIRRRLGRLTIHLVAVAGDDAGVYERHDYERAMRTQLQHGIIDYCGARRGAMTFVYDSESADDDARGAAVAASVAAVRAAVEATRERDGVAR